MASLCAVSSLSGLKVQGLKATRSRVATTSSRPSVVVCSAGNAWDKVGKTLVAAGAGLLVATSAHAATVKLGADSGALVFEPASITVSVGEEVTFINNAGFPHNIVFDEDGVPDGVKVDDISQPEYLNAPNEKYVVKLTVPGSYSIYCEPHQGAGMKGTITVK